MPRWTAQDYAEYQARRSTSSAKPKRFVLNDSLGSPPGKEADRARFSIRITSYRVRLIDPDNMCGKYFVDCLRYSGIIPDDTAAVVDYSIKQEGVSSKAEERTIIEVAVLVSS